jgi:YD repeat-containing protein
MNCRGCGVELDPSDQQVNAAVDQVLESSLQDAERRGGVCPLCGHDKRVRYSQSKSVLFALLVAWLLAVIVLTAILIQTRRTKRAEAANDALARMSANSEIIQRLGQPISISPGVLGDIEEDETGWNEAHLSIPIRGPNGEALAHVNGGRTTGPWVFTTFEVDFEKQHEKLDLISGRIVSYEPNGYVEVHTQAAGVPEYSQTVAAPPSLDGSFPCVFSSVKGREVDPVLGKCAMPTTPGDPVDRFEADLRYGNFVLRETDLFLDDVFKVPLTRTYVSNEWVSPNPVHAFGRQTNHPYDIAPLGTRNPYTYQLIVLEDGDFLYFDRISRGTGYANSVFQHTETSTRFYKAITRWNGRGWTTRLADGSEIHFPESYNAKNLAQGAPTEMTDPSGNRLELVRDAKRNLQEIRTPHGHWIRFSYDDLSRVTRAEDDKGNWVKYEYHPDGMLGAAIHSSGKERHYQYEGRLMTHVLDESGRLLLRNWYQGRFLVRQEFANGDLYSYWYDWRFREYCPRRVTVTSPDHVRDVAIPNSVPDHIKNYHP